MRLVIQLISISDFRVFISGSTSSFQIIDKFWIISGQSNMKGNEEIIVSPDGFLKTPPTYSSRSFLAL